MRKGRKAALLIAAWILAFDVTAAWTPAAVKAEETTELTDGTYNYTVNADGTTATLTKYIGSAADVVIPETIGDGLTVTILGANIFSNNTNVTRVFIPKTVQNMGQYTTEFYGAYKLENIIVSEENSYFFDVDGILFKRISSGILLVKYPEGKKLTEYVVPKNVSIINQLAFKDSKANKEQYKITIPSTVSEIWLQAFSSIQVELNLTHTDTSLLTIQQLAFNHLQSGSKIIVRNAEIKEKVLAAMNECAEDVQVINLADLSEEEQKAYLVPATSLTWDGTNTTGKTTLSPGEKCQLSCKQLPANTTDNVVWSSSDPAVAKVDATTGLIEASGGVNYTLKTGTTTITGTDESGHSITLEVTVLKPVESMEFYYPQNQVMNVEYTGEEIEKTVSLDITPITANNANNVLWSSSNTNVATAEKSATKADFINGDVYASYGTVKIIAPGTTTITATLDDNGTIWTKSFVLTVTEGSDSGNGSNAGGDNGTIIPGDDMDDEDDDDEDDTGGDNGKVTPPPTVKKDTQIVMTMLSKGKITNTAITLTYGTTATVKAKAEGKTTISVKNRNIVSLTSSGKLTPKNTGVTTLTVKAAATSKYEARSKTFTVIVLPKKETVTYAKSLKAKQLTVKWKKDTKATGYQIQYSTSNRFTAKTTKTITVKKNRTTSQTIKKLSAGKKYYVRVRAYKTMKISGKNVNKYGAWSARKTVSVKR